MAKKERNNEIKCVKSMNKLALKNNKNNEQKLKVGMTMVSNPDPRQY